METKAGETKYLSCTETAKLIRAELKRAYPGHKFKVRSERSRTCQAIDIEWTEGASLEEVERLVDRFRGSDFDPVADLRTRRPAGEVNGQPVYFGADYIHCRRWTAEQTQRADDYRRFQSLLEGVKL